MIYTIMNYGVGNIRSVMRVIEKFNRKVKISKRMDDWLSADALIIPGVGAFDAVMNVIDDGRELLSHFNSNVPVLGICIGMHVLMKGSEEGKKLGLSFMNGFVKKVVAKKIPHMGWNRVFYRKKETIFNGIESGSYFYFAHSYICDCLYSIAYFKYCNMYPAVIKKKRVYGTQFHPEKSGSTGIKLIENFINIAEGGQ